MIETNCDINEKTPRGGWPPIVLAASKGHTMVVGQLLDLGADINAQVDRRQDTGSFAEFDLVTFDGSSAIYLASHEGHCETLKYLIKRGANVDQKKTNGSTVRFSLSLSIITVITYDFSIINSRFLVLHIEGIRKLWTFSLMRDVMLAHQGLTV